MKIIKIFEENGIKKVERNIKTGKKVKKDIIYKTLKDEDLYDTFFEEIMDESIDDNFDEYFDDIYKVVDKKIKEEFKQKEIILNNDFNKKEEEMNKKNEILIKEKENIQKNKNNIDLKLKEEILKNNNLRNDISNLKKGIKKDIYDNLDSNGCGGEGSSFKPPYSVFFKTSCEKHDYYYAKGGNQIDRLVADIYLLEYMKLDIKENVSSFKKIYFYI